LKEAFETGRFDLAVLAIKGFDTAGFLEIIKPEKNSMPRFCVFKMEWKMSQK
jgi:hypothetical protein